MTEIDEDESKLLDLASPRELAVMLDFQKVYPQFTLEDIFKKAIELGLVDGL